ncbi:MAG: MFS transporter [Gammaproteobacteria bacterium]|nr:MFS transporter [Gammaproteobacteria bacterium]
MPSEAPPWYRWVLLSGVWLQYAAFGLVATSLAPLTGLIESDLKLTHAEMGTTMGAWQLVYIVSAIPCGILLDKLGPRWALIIGSLLIALSVFTRGTADNFFELILAVMLFGLGGPIISAGAPKVIAEWFTGSSRGMAMGIYMTGPAIGGLVSLTMTHSVLLPALDGAWQNVMFLWAGVTVFATIIWLILTSHPLMRVSSGSGGTGGLPQTRVLILLVKEPAVLLVLIMSIGVFLFNHGLNNWLPELLRSGGMTLIEAGYWAAIPTVIGLAGSLLIPRLATPERRFPILTGLSVAAALASVLLQFQAPSLMFTGLILQGIARSSLMTILVLTLVELPGVGQKHVGVATGLFFSAAEVGGVLGPMSLGLLYDWTNEFNTGLFMLTGVAVMIFLGTLRLKMLCRT